MVISKVDPDISKIYEEALGDEKLKRVGKPWGSKGDTTTDKSTSSTDTQPIQEQAQTTTRTTSNASGTGTSYSY